MPLGSDAALWGLAAMQIEHLRSPGVTPLYPALIAAVDTVSGAPAWWSGGVISALAAAAVPPALLVILRRIGLGWAWAIPLAVAPLLSPRLLVMALHLQPDSLTQLMILIVVAAGLRWDRTPSASHAALWIGAALALALTREHGVIVLPAIGLILALRAGLPWWTAAVAAVGGGLALWFGSDALPDRLRTPLQSSPLGAGDFPLPEYMTHFRNERGRPLREAWMTGDSFGFWRLIVGELLRRNAYHLIGIGVGAVGFIWQRRVSGLAALAPALALLFFWSHERHSAVLMPAAYVGVGLILFRLKTPGRLGMIAACIAYAAWPAQEAGHAWQKLEGAAQHAEERRQLAAWMAQQPGPWMLAGLDNEINLYLGWSRHVPLLAPDCAQKTWDGAGWNSLWVGPTPLMPAPMVPVYTLGHSSVFRLEGPEGLPRPCQDVVLPETPMYIRGLRPVETSPRCAADVAVETYRGRPPCAGPPMLDDEDGHLHR